MKKIILLTLVALPFCACAQQKKQPATDQQVLKEALTAIMLRQDSLVEEFQHAPTELVNTQEYQLAMQYQYDELAQQQNKVCIDFIQKHKDSPVSLTALMMMSQEHGNLTIIDSLFQLLTPAVKKTIEGQEFNAFLKKHRATAIGSIALDFKMNDTNGKTVKLSDFRGKYVLVDFWASWCMPCRKENPTIVRAYNQYKNKNFTILGVSLDDNKEAWLRAIEKDLLTWTQVSDLKKWEVAPVAKLYSISSIPYNLLLDPKGKIIAKNLRDEALADELAKVFD